MQPEIPFAKRVSIQQVEEGDELAPKFNADGLLPCVTTDSNSGELLMVGYLNDAALRLCITTGEAHYFSRSRKKLWKKGETSGLSQTIVQMRIDDDQDCVWLQVEPQGGASCHVGYRSCFYRSIPLKPHADKVSPQKSVNSKQKTTNDAPVKLNFEEKHKVFDPKKAYQGTDNPTIL